MWLQLQQTTCITISLEAHSGSDIIGLLLRLSCSSLSSLAAMTEPMTRPKASGSAAAAEPETEGAFDDWNFNDLVTWDQDTNREFEDSVGPGNIVIYAATCPVNASLSDKDCFECKMGLKHLACFTDWKLAKKRSLVHASTSTNHNLGNAEAQQLVEQTPQCVQVAEVTKSSWDAYLAWAAQKAEAEKAKARQKKESWKKDRERNDRERNDREKHDRGRDRTCDRDRSRDRKHQDRQRSARPPSNRPPSPKRGPITRPGPRRSPSRAPARRRGTEERSRSRTRSEPRPAASRLNVLNDRPMSLIPVQISSSLPTHTSQKSLLLEWLTRVEGSMMNSSRLLDFVSKAIREESMQVGMANLACLCFVSWCECGVVQKKR